MARLSPVQTILVTCVCQALIVWASRGWVMSLSVQRAESLSANGQFGRALRIQRVVTVVDPRNLDALIGLGRSYEDLDRDKQAERTYWTIIDRFPDRNEGYYLMSRLIRKTGDEFNADGWLEKAAERSGQFSDQIASDRRGSRPR
ncbi:hypothetical protein EB093_01770 [bacterium]|nr:hypothetical protein [bacterium]